MCIRDSVQVAHAATLTYPLARSLITGSLWEMVRTANLSPSVFLDYLLRAIPIEDHPTSLRTLLLTCLLYTSRCV